MSTKNIIWSTGSGVVITTLSPGEDSQQHAADMREGGVADPTWSPVAYDVALSNEQLASVGDLKWLGGALVLDAAAGAARRWVAHQEQAQVALDASDITMLRCLEHGVPVPADWVTYRAALRAIVRAASGDASQPLPTRPAYPAGT